MQRLYNYYVTLKSDVNKGSVSQSVSGQPRHSLNNFPVSNNLFHLYDEGASTSLTTTPTSHVIQRD